MKSFVLLAILFTSSVATAFPEMIRHGYVHCTACHTNLTGGGLLNEYGRTLSGEVLSWKSKDGEGDFLYGVKTPEWLSLGGDVRTLQLFQESSAASRGRFFIMQVDFDAHARVNDRLAVFASVGRIEPKSTEVWARDFFTIPRVGLDYTISDPESPVKWGVRAGRFMPVYGIAFPEHKLMTRTMLNFEPGQERYAMELSRVDDDSSMVLTGIFGQAVENQNKIESGGAFQYAHALGASAKLSVNYYETTRDDGAGPWKRRMYGVNALAGFTKEFYGLFEIDRMQDATEKWGLAETSKLGYELVQGWHVFAIHEFGSRDSSQTDPRLEAYSLGTEWFPRPHFDLYMALRKERDTGLSNEFVNSVWLLAHFYL